VPANVRSVLVVANDGLPVPGAPVSGSGLRAWGLGEGLRSKGHEVTYALPRVSAPAGTPAPPAGPILFDADTFAGIAAGFDVLVFQHWVWAGVAEGLDVPVAVDLHGPLMVETAFQRRPGADFVEMARVKLAAFHRADFISCAGRQQRRYFLPWVMLAGGDVTTDAISVIPVSLGPDLPAHEPTGDVNFVFGGLFLPWQDPTLGLDALVEVLEAEGAGRLDFFGAPHPSLEMDTGVYAELEARLRDSERVVVHGLRPRDELLDVYRRSWVALDVMRRNSERELAFTTRTVEYLWCGLPVVYADYGELAGMIAGAEAGWIVPDDDRAGLVELLTAIVRDPAEIERRSANAQVLARDRLNWERTIDPLDEFVRHPRRSTSGPPLLVDRRDVDAARAELDAMRSTKIMRVLEPARRLYGRLRRRDR